MPKGNIESLSRFTAGPAGEQFLEQMRKHLQGKVIESIEYALTDDQVLVRVVVEGGMAFALAVPEIGPDWEDNPPEFLDSFRSNVEGLHVMGEPGAKEEEAEKSDGSDKSRNQG